MTESDILRMISQVVKQELAAIRMATINSNQDQNRSTFQHFSSSSPIQNARNIQPFGISSRAPAGTSCLAIPIAYDPTHINVVGHFDESRPTGEDGETLLYNSFGQLIYLSDGKIQIGSKAAAENLVLGQVFKTFAANLLELIANHTHAGLGYPPANAADFEALKSSPINDGAILSDENFTEKGS